MTPGVKGEIVDNFLKEKKKVLKLIIVMIV